MTRLENVVGRARSGVSGVTVVRGDAGLGKSTLLGIAARAAQDLIVVRCRGIESEQSMPYAGLHLLCSTVRADLTELGRPQAAAMAKAFGRAEGDADPFLVGLATESVLTAAARHRPALWLIDDAQWLDDQSAAALAFVLRRLNGSPVSAVVSTRSTGDDQFAEFPDLHLTGLTDTDARSLLRTTSYGRIDDIVLERIVAESRGNPRTLLHVAAEVTSATFAAGYGLAPNPILSPERLRALTARMAGLDPDQRLLLVLAAADSTGDPALLWRASEILGIDRCLASAAEDQGLLRLGAHVLFPEPAERTAVYRSATAGERADVHRALADATGTPDRRTWHLACASAEPNDALALELELQAAGVGSRLGQAGAAAFLERSALLTSDGQLRAERALAAADARFEAGSAADCAQMLITAALGQLDEPGRAHLDHHRARLAFSARRNGPAAEQLLQTAQALHQLDEPSAGEGFLEALVAATHAGRLGPGVDVVANKLPGDRVVDGLVGQLLEGLTARFASGFRDGCRVLIPTPVSTTDPEPADRRWRWLRSWIAADLWDDAGWERLSTQAVGSTRETGSLMRLPYALSSACLAQLHLGHFEQADRLAEEIAAVATSTHVPSYPSAALLLAGWIGDEQAAVVLMDSARRDARHRGEGAVLSTVALSAAVLYNGLGRYDAALEAARDAAARDELVTFGWALVELIEAASRTRRPDLASAAFTELDERTTIAGSDWALGIQARSRALVTEGPDAEPLYQEAIERLSRSAVRTHLARSQLVYGEWLRRRGRRLDARGQLRAAWESLDAMGATAFAGRAHREHLATGEKVASLVSGHGRPLTPQETRIAALAREGLTNPEIGERLYLSPRTVEYHLHKVFEKLGISSRRDLIHAIGQRLDADGTDP